MSDWTEEKFNSLIKDVHELKETLAYIANRFKEVKEEYYCDPFTAELTYYFDCGKVTVEEGETNDSIYSDCYRRETFSVVYIYDNKALEEKLDSIMKIKLQEKIKRIEKRKLEKEKEDLENNIRCYEQFKKLYPNYIEKYRKEMKI